MKRPNLLFKAMFNLKNNGPKKTTRDKVMTISKLSKTYINRFFFAKAMASVLECTCNFW